MTARPRRRGGGVAWMGIAALAVACAGASPTTTDTAVCPAASAGQSLCGSCGSLCSYCATGTCPSDPCTDHSCDATSECSTVDTAAGHEGWSYCGLCTSSSECVYCAPGTCSSDPCSTKCDSTGGYGPVQSGSGGSGSSSGGVSGGSSGTTSGGVTTCGNCPGQLECSTIVGKCVVQSCTCYYVIDGSDGGSAWYLANGECFMCQQNGINTGDCTAAANAAAQAIVNCE